jgi:hypothetical protein
MPYIRTDAKTIGKIVERGNIDTPCTQIHDHSLFWLDTGPSIKHGRVKTRPIRPLLV